MKESWEISILEYVNTVCKKFKVTRRYPEEFIAETKIFTTKEEAVEQAKEWLE